MWPNEAFPSTPEMGQSQCGRRTCFDCQGLRTGNLSKGPSAETKSCGLADNSGAASALCRLGEKSASHAKSRYIPEGWPGHSKVFGLPLDGMWEP